MEVVTLKPRTGKRCLLLDCDELVPETIKDALRWHNRVYGTSCALDDRLKNYSYAEGWGCSKEEESERVAAWLEQYDPLAVGIVPGAIEGVKRLSETWDIAVVSSRAPHMVSKTVALFRHYLPGAVCAVFHVGWGELASCDKGHVARCTGAVAGVDDLPAHAESYVRAGIRGIVFGCYPWNAKPLPPGVEHTPTWLHLVRALA